MSQKTITIIIIRGGGRGRGGGGERGGGGWKESFGGDGFVCDIDCSDEDITLSIVRLLSAAEKLEGVLKVVAR